MALTVQITKLELKAGDTLAVLCEENLHCQQFDTMTQYVQSRVPDGVKVMILDDGLQLAKISATESQT
jgi:hypothetical protein